MGYARCLVLEITRHRAQRIARHRRDKRRYFRQRTAATSLDSVVHIWDIEGGEMVKNLRGHIDSVYSIAFMLDGKKLFSGNMIRRRSIGISEGCMVRIRRVIQREGWKVNLRWIQNGWIRAYRSPFILSSLLVIHFLMHWLLLPPS